MIENELDAMPEHRLDALDGVNMNRVINGGSSRRNSSSPNLMRSGLNLSEVEQLDLNGSGDDDNDVNNNNNEREEENNSNSETQIFEENGNLLPESSLEPENDII